MEKNQSVANQAVVEKSESYSNRRSEEFFNSKVSDKTRSMLKCKGAAQDLVHNVYDVLIDTFGDAMTEQMLESFKSHVFEAEKEIDKFIIELINDNSSPYNVTEI